MQILNKNQHFSVFVRDRTWEKIQTENEKKTNRKRKKSRPKKGKKQIKKCEKINQKPAKNLEKIYGARCPARC